MISYDVPLSTTRLLLDHKGPQETTICLNYNATSPIPPKSIFMRIISRAAQLHPRAYISSRPIHISIYRGRFFPALVIHYVVVRLLLLLVVASSQPPCNPLRRRLFVFVVIASVIVIVYSLLASCYSLLATSQLATYDLPVTTTC